jgi:prepilin-type N-terminal cleavage/methylation domain-containing protein
MGQNLPMKKYIRTKVMRRPAAFTLIELLVVIAIISILAAMLLPVLYSAQQKGYAASCLNNQKQIIESTMMYVDDNSGYLPYCNSDLGNAPGPGWLYSGAMLNANLNTNNPICWETGTLWDYLKTPNVYLCPLDIRNPYFTMRANQLSSYIWDWAESGYDESVYQNCKVSTVWSPECILFWEPYIPGNSTVAMHAYNDGANYPYYPGYQEGLGYLHDKRGGNVARLDGSVVFMRQADFNADAETVPGQGSGPGGKTYTWWSTLASNGH